MKKTFCIEVLLLFVFIVLIACCASYFIIVANNLAVINVYKQHNENYLEVLTGVYIYSILGTFSILAILADLAAMIIIAIKDFPAFKPLADKLNARKEQRQQAKDEKAEADKQAKIERLQAELGELKKDE